MDRPNSSKTMAPDDPKISAEGGLAPGDAGQPRKRRARYRGTHPRQFEQRYKELAPEQYPDEIAKVRARGHTPAGAHIRSRARSRWTARWATADTPGRSPSASRPAGS
jgi:hypothetical protein